MSTDNKLTNFYSDLRVILEKHQLIMDCTDNYNSEGWCGQTFTLRSKEAVNGKYPIYIESLSDFVENASETFGGDK